MHGLNFKSDSFWHHHEPDKCMKKNAADHFIPCGASHPHPLQNITDEDVLALVSDEVHQPTAIWTLHGLQVGMGRGGKGGGEGGRGTCVLVCSVCLALARHAGMARECSVHEHEGRRSHVNVQ